MQIAKKCIFFDYYEYYRVVVPFGVVSVCISRIARLVFLMGIVYSQFNRYQDHIGMTLVSCYLIVTLEIVNSLANGVHYESIAIIVAFSQPILRLQFQRIRSFPYFSRKTHIHYQDMNAQDSSIGIKIGLLSLGLVIGNYFFFARKVKYSEQKSLDKFNTFEIINILLDGYLYFFMGLAQIQINKRFETVRHLSKGFIILYTLIAISDDFWGLIYS